jgi:hypothetical protein
VKYDWLTNRATVEGRASFDAHGQGVKNVTRRHKAECEETGFSLFHGEEIIETLENEEKEARPTVSL